MPGAASCPVLVEEVAYPRRSCSASPPKEMVPAHPPLPTPANLPFHFSSGSHTSNRICDSALGVMTPATRQNGGRLATGAPAGGVNDPPVTASAVVIVVLDSS